MNREENLAYQRGYYARSTSRWPDHKPPLPPDSVIAEIITAAQQLRDGVDGELAKFEEDDPMAEVIYSHIERLDSALKAVSTWLLSPETEDL